MTNNKDFFKIKSNSDPKKFYNVTWNAERKDWDCQCEFKKYHPMRMCSHIKKAMELFKKNEL